VWESLTDFDLWLAGGYPFEPPKMQFVTKVWYATLLPIVCILDFSFPLHNVPTWLHMCCDISSDQEQLAVIDNSYPFLQIFD